MGLRAGFEGQGGGGEEEVGAGVFGLDDGELPGTEGGLEAEDVGAEGGGAVRVEGGRVGWVCVRGKKELLPR